jgi:hypothetical protein
MFTRENKIASNMVLLIVGNSGIFEARVGELAKLHIYQGGQMVPMGICH